MDANMRAFLSYLAEELRLAVGTRTGKMERKVLKVAKALESVAE